VSPAHIMPIPLTNLEHNRYAKALESFTYLRPAPVSSLLAARDLVYAHFQLEAENQFMEDEKINKDKATANKDIATRLQQSTRTEIEPARDDTKRTASYHISKTMPHQRFAQTFRDPRSRRALVCASTAMISQQLTGINTIGKYFSRMRKV
jgi:hypothetical protein